LLGAFREDFGVLAVFGSEVGDDHRSAQLCAELHRVFHRRHRLLAPVFFDDGENGEIRGMNRELDIAFGS
jgi:hypothetical protein